MPNAGPYIYDVKISGFTRSSIYYDISRLRVNAQFYILYVTVNLLHVSVQFLSSRVTVKLFYRGMF
jgi:hypothetical protein